jgi:hypothetical protein
MKYLLLVTWFAFGQAPSNYQAEFATAEACAAAVAAVEAEQLRLAKRYPGATAEKAPDGSLILSNSGPAPTASAVCVQK